MSRQISNEGRAFIERLEGVPGTGEPVLVAYQDSAGVWTAGWGSTRGVTAGAVYTREECVAMLDRDLADAERAVSDNVTVPLNDNQFDALVSFAFNIGVAAFLGSTLLKLLNGGHYTAVPGQLALWVNVTVGGAKHHLAGLVNRRTAEASLWMTPATVAIEPIVLTIQPDDAPPAELVATPITIPVAASSSATPIPPPTTVVQTKSGKSVIVATITGVGAAVSGGVEIAQPAIDAANKVKDATGGFAHWGLLAVALLVTISVAFNAWSLWQKHKEVQGK